MRSTLRRLFLVGSLLAAFGARGFAAVGAVQSTVEPSQVNIGDEATVTYTLSGGDVEDFQLPGIDGVTVEGESTSARISISNASITQNFTHTFLIVANRAGSVIIPAFDLKTADGKTLRTQALTLHVVGAAGSSSSTPLQSTPATPGSRDNPSNGPVVMPPPDQDADNAQQQQEPQGNPVTVNVPTDPDGQPARVFDVITADTTTAYVGQAVPLKIESYIRLDANAQQDSLPALTGSNFLMNALSLRPQEDGVNLGNIEYIRDTWYTAISAPGAGDFNLQATRDTYWTKSAPPSSNFGILFGRPAQLMHRDILSNQMTMHILPLPDEGKPPGFTGAIGKFQVSGTAIPTSVGVGEPVTLRFTITGQGNFDYVRSPALAASPNWKAYTATSKITYQGEAHIQAMKIFEQAIIPQRNGTVALPAATFSYFDPDLKRYINIPVALPPITVTGAMPETPAAPATSADQSAQASLGSAPGTPASTIFAPNRLNTGWTTRDLQPAYHKAWFWVVQILLLIVITAGIVLAALGPRRDTTRNDRALRFASLRRAEDAMTEAAAANDAVKFFSSARRAVQLQLAERWHVSPESLTLLEINRRDPALGETVAPLFAEADDVIYSGANRSGLNLNEWDRRVREMLQPARV